MHIPTARPTRRPPAVRRRLTRGGAAGLALLLGVALPATATAATSHTGPEGQQVTVSKATGLDAEGETITVTGSGFDLAKGIYVALCVDQGPGQAPSPCLGGVDMDGTSGSSAWISSNPPAYGEGLAEPFEDVGGKGSFSVQLSVAANDEFTDCLDTSAAPNGCVVGTRADHTRSADRSADVRIPVSFTAAGSGGESGTGGESGSGEDTGSRTTPTPSATTPPTPGPGTTPTPGATTTATSADDLARTGTELLPVTAVALLAVVGGTALLARRRTTTS
ncbi:hypothetical protein [Phytoactinopolyspora limicola]|uniref:hypothetical protein n=1 Tax=Phytoactinopolyspora limicola TaxID=2715536 RepID=UPI00140BFEAE|nr:hypothetical protein [Phytoactinopolyspora limicola]